jgi:hypothetical protein
MNCKLTLHPKSNINTVPETEQYRSLNTHVHGKKEPPFNPPHAIPLSKYAHETANTAYPICPSLTLVRNSPIPPSRLLSRKTAPQAGETKSSGSVSPHYVHTLVLMASRSRSSSFSSADGLGLVRTLERGRFFQCACVSLQASGGGA